jgi:hypothetical protein
MLVRVRGAQPQWLFLSKAFFHPRPPGSIPGQSRSLLNGLWSIVSLPTWWAPPSIVQHPSSNSEAPPRGSRRDIEVRVLAGLLCAGGLYCESPGSQGLFGPGPQNPLGSGLFMVNEACSLWFLVQTLGPLLCPHKLKTACVWGRLSNTVKPWEHWDLQQQQPTGPPTCSHGCVCVHTRAGPPGWCRRTLGTRWQHIYSRATHKKKKTTHTHTHTHFHLWRLVPFPPGGFCYTSLLSGTPQSWTEELINKQQIKKWNLFSINHEVKLPQNVHKRV